MVPEIERAACTMLARALDRIANPELAEWVRRLLADPECTEGCPKGAHPNDLHPSFTYKGSGGPLDDDQWWLRAYLRDRAIADLAGALAIYRLAGRPEGDQTSWLYGSGEEGSIGITSSLAAAVAEYCEEMIRAAVAE